MWGPPAAFQDDRALYHSLLRVGIMDGTFDFGRLCRVVDRALESETGSEDASGFLEGVGSVLA
jgi:hypothetical protein